MKHVNLTTWHLASARDPFEEEVVRWFNTFFSQRRPEFIPTQGSWVPAADVYETEDSLHIRVELAGVREEDVEVKLSGRYLIVHGKRCRDEHVHAENYHLMEIPYGTFRRVFDLQTIYDPAHVTASLSNGFLTITIKKGHLKDQEVRIEIQ